MATYLEQVADQVREWDAARERSQQREPGWSNMADCRAYLGYLVAGEWPSDDEENWRAVAGTALHRWMAELRGQVMSGKDVDFEVATSYRGIPGHADEVNRADNSLTDWKFPRLGSVRVWDDPDVLAEKFVQVHGYAAGVVAEGLLDPDGLVVRMLLAPVDGTFADWQMYEQPFDQRIADEAADRYETVKAQVAAGEKPPRDKHVFWCERFCEFFTQCRGGESFAEWPLITDEETATALQRYGEIAEVHSEAEKAMKELAPLLRGVRGQARGWRVSMSKTGESKQVLDEDAVARQYELEGRDLPMRWKAGRSASLLVRREKT